VASDKNLRVTADGLPDVTVRTANGRSAPLAQFVKFETVFEDGVRWRRNRFPAISVRADVADGMLAPDVAAQIIPQLKSIEDNCRPAISSKPARPRRTPGSPRSRS
jgi:Cation/multidrug efflux pump